MNCPPNLLFFSWMWRSDNPKPGLLHPGSSLSYLKKKHLIFYWQTPFVFIKKYGSSVTFLDEMKVFDEWKLQLLTGTFDRDDLEVVSIRIFWRPTSTFGFLHFGNLPVMAKSTMKDELCTLTFSHLLQTTDELCKHRIYLFQCLLVNLFELNITLR